MSARLLVASCLLVGLLSPSLSRAQQTIAPDAGCMQQKGEYTCNWSSFLNVFEHAHTIAVEAGPMDRSTAAQLRRLVTELGRTPVAPGDAADVTFDVTSVPPHGVDLGPGDHDLARLRVYASRGTSAHDTLLWAETYRGQGDRPWPAQVHALLGQFQDRFPAHR